jgi:hypothetical protein
MCQTSTRQKNITIVTRFSPVRVFRFEDAIADRISAFLHWADSQSLEVAERAVRADEALLDGRR